MAALVTRAVMTVWLVIALTGMFVLHNIPAITNSFLRNFEKGSPTHEQISRLSTDMRSPDCVRTRGYRGRRVLQASMATRAHLGPSSRDRAGVYPCMHYSQSLLLRVMIGQFN